MTKTRNRLISVGTGLLLFIAAVLFIIPQKTAGAETWIESAAEFAAGDGTQGAPYQISSAGELANLAKMVSGGETYESTYFELTADIDLGGKEWTPIGTKDSQFAGKLFGNGKTIRNLTVGGGDNRGLFAYSSGEIKDVYLEKIDITTTMNAGGVCAFNSGTIEGCGVLSGTIICSNPNGGQLGGICMENSGTISRCFSNASVKGATSAGIVYINRGIGVVQDCYNTGTLEGSSSASGINTNNYGKIKTCLNLGAVIAEDKISEEGSVIRGYGICVMNVPGASLENCYSDSNVCPKELFGGFRNNTTVYYKTTAELCGGSLPDGFDGSVWNVGSIGGIADKDAADRFAAKSYTYPSLNGVGSAAAREVEVYNFSTDSTPDWQEFKYIETVEDFRKIEDDLSGNYVLAQDIDFGGNSYRPIAYKSGSSFTGKFSGMFSGNGHTVTMTDDSTCGLFGTNKGTIINLAVKGNIDSSVGSNMRNYSGGICAVNDGTIYGCSFEGKIYGGANNTGAVCGLNNKTISNCFALANVKATNGQVGGIAALGKEDSELQDCYFVGTVTTNANGLGVISVTSSKNCYYNKEVCQFAEEESGTALTTLEMTSYGALAKMNFTDDIWEKLPNDTANGVAYYPSFKGSTYVPSVKYTAKLELNRSGDEAPVYGDDIEFTTKALILFRNDYYGDDVSVEDTTGTFNAEVGGKTIIVVANRFEDTADAVGDITYRLIYKGSDYFPDDYSEDFIVTVGKKALTVADFNVALPADMVFSNTEKAVTVTAKPGITGAGEITVKYYGESGKEAEPFSAGTYTFKIDAAEGSNYKAVSGLTADSWKFTIEKAGAETLPDTGVSYRWSTDKDITVSVAGLPENMGQVTVVRTKKDGTISAGIIPGSCYSDGKFTFHLGPNTVDDIGKTGSFTITLAADNYESVTFTVKITLTAKDNQDAPDPAAFYVVFTNDGSELTATIKTGLKGVEYSFDGTTWSGVNTTTVAHLKDVTAYLRFKETDELNASEAVFKTVKSGHGKLVHHAAVQATCQNTGNIEYWECETCAKYYSDEAAAAEVSLADVIIAKTDHKWSVKYTYDKNGHWHKCEYCDAVTGAESHVSSGEATATQAEYCTVCGYIITPKKGGGSSGGYVSGGSHSRDNTTETNPSINGEQKTWSDIAADLGRQNGGSATISMSGETTVTAEVIKAIADRRVKVEFVYDSTKSWLIDGAKITTVSAADLSLFPGSVDTSSLRGVSGGKYRISADIPAEIRFTFLKRYAGEFANVYKLVDGKLVFQTCIKLAEDGTAVVPGMSAPGEYAVMVCRYSDRQGDFDNNGVLDIYDAVALLRYSVGLESGENLQLIDLNGDGMVNCADASMVLRWVVGLSA